MGRQCTIAHRACHIPSEFSGFAGLPPGLSVFAGLPATDVDRLFPTTGDGGHADAVVELDPELDAAGCGPVSARKCGKMINIMMAAVRKMTTP